MSIRIFATGGTFDKEYNEIKEVLYFNDTHIKEILDVARCTIGYDLRSLMLIDSLDMTDQDRQNILESCEKADSNEIIITHGTSTMENTAKYLGKASENGSPITEKTIVLTGAMLPYQFPNSDAMFNLGTAIAFVKSLHPGVYISMNGKYFLWNNVTKNTKTGLFEQRSN